MNDMQLRQNVIDELDFEPSIDAAGIGVAAENGVVTLTGHVPTYEQKLAAERAVWRVKGVKALAEEIEVRLPSDKKTSDDEIAERAIRILAWSSSVPPDAIKVKVQDGFVTLSGRVEWNFQREAAVRAVRRLGGVVGVIDDLMLESKACAADVEERIRSALQRHAEVEAAGIRVSVVDGCVDLSGKVDNWDERRAVEQAAWSVPGVQQVRADLRIA